MRFNPKLFGLLLIVLGLVGCLLPRLQAQDACQHNAGSLSVLSQPGRSSQAAHESPAATPSTPVPDALHPASGQTPNAPDVLPPASAQATIVPGVTQPTSVQTTTDPHAIVSQPSRESGEKRQACKVLTVYDGDTLGCDLNGDGQIERPAEEIRLLGIDSPEMHYSRKNPTHDSAHPVDEPFAPEASRWMEAHALHRMIYLEFDTRRSDRYERTLAYAYSGPTETESFNAQLLATGYAKILFLGKNRRHEDAFQRIEAQARQAQRGLWGVR